MKYFRMSYEEVVFNRSYINILLLNRSIPSFNFDKDKEGDNGGRSPKSKGYTVNKTRFRNETELFMSLM